MENIPEKGLLEPDIPVLCRSEAISGGWGGGGGREGEREKVESHELGVASQKRSQRLHKAASVYTD